MNEHAKILLGTPLSISSSSTMAAVEQDPLRPVTSAGPLRSDILDSSLSSARSSSSITIAADDLPRPPYPGKGTIDEPYLVDFLPNDQTNPYNWSNMYRWGITGLIGVATLCPPFASVSYSSTIGEVTQAFGISRELAIAGISFFITGFGLGPLIWAPISEIWGRNIAFIASYPAFCIFTLGTALSHNTVALMVTRLFAGAFGSSPLTNAGAQIGDMWGVHERAVATSVFSLAPFLGPVLGPIVGGYVTERCGYRWVYWITFIYASVMTVATILIVPETYAPTILRKKARQLQAASEAEGRNEVFIAKYDRIKKTKVEIIKIGLTRPFQLLFTELIVGCLAIYGALIYGILYLFFTAFPIVFQEVRGWTVGEGGLAFLGMGVGLILGNIINPLGNIWYRRASTNGRTAPPEARLPMCCIGAVLAPIGLFWFAWTSAPPVHWIVPIVGCIPFGLAFLLIFTSITNYTIDSYSLYAASALAAQAVLRCMFGAVFPLFASQLYGTLGLHWAGTLIAFLSLVCVPMPFLFYKYGAFLRRKSRYAPSSPVSLEEREKETPEQIVDEQKDELRKVKTRPDEALEPEWAGDAGEHAREGGEVIRGGNGRDLEKGI
ncbi:hypothetical protein IAR55_001933 [Kwoniella newhampshirensis]|uniref:Major facilitator superfamily (MFS) profile domain-containing protein n=1 Tax=Kwoniella newhampshirensis TaxID=1651941 RepID=A0AAW0Z3K0_9TREE